MRPSASAMLGICGCGSDANPSASTMCKPTRRFGRSRARRTASAAAAPPTIKLAAVRMPLRLACSTASLTASCKPKSSAVTIKCRCINPHRLDVAVSPHFIVIVAPLYAARGETPDPKTEVQQISKRHQQQHGRRCAGTARVEMNQRTRQGGCGKNCRGCRGSMSEQQLQRCDRQPKRDDGKNISIGT